MSEAPTADDLKKQGNDAFSKREFDTAIKLYTKAISLDASNHLIFSNRSACYAGKGNWDASSKDAKECIRLDPTFLKGYYRLAMAQLELKDTQAAIATIKQGLNLDAGNAQFTRLLQQAKKAIMTKAPTTSRPAFSMPTGAGGNEEMEELQQQYLTTMREARTVEANISYAQREFKSNELTQAELGKLPPEFEGGMYRSIGKIFLKSSREEVEDHLKDNMKEQEKSQEELKQKQAYLERQLKSLQTNMKELMSAAKE